MLSATTNSVAFIHLDILTKMTTCFEDSTVLINGFGFSGYRSFGDELVKISPLKKVNLIIGKNNVGKSNIISFLDKYYSYFVLKARSQGSNNQQTNNFTEVDRHISNERVDHRIAFSLVDEELSEFINSKIQEQPNGQHKRHRELAHKLLDEVPKPSRNTECIQYVLTQALYGNSNLCSQSTILK